MSTRTDTTELIIIRKGRNDRRYRAGNIYLRLMPDSRTPQRIMVRRTADTGAVYDLFLTDEEAYAVADALDDILAYIERNAA
jgi:hypothetical protein